MAMLRTSLRTGLSCDATLSVMMGGAEAVIAGRKVYSARRPRASQLGSSPGPRLQPDPRSTDDAPVHPAVAALPFADKGLVLGALVAHMPPEAFAARFPGAAGGQAALAALASETRTTRASTLAELLALVRAPVPAGIERIHPDWLRERLAAEPSPVVQAVSQALPPEVRQIADALLSERGESRAPTPVPATAAAELGRRVFAALVPVAGPGAPAGPEAAPLMALPLAAVAEAVELRGAFTLGVSLRGAPGEVVGRAAANLGDRLAGALVEAAAKTGPAQARDAARRLVERVAGERPSDLAAHLGARALAVALVPEGRDATQAVAQRLAPPLGRRLLAFAAEAEG